ncbi:MAG: RagB/SusD family nutrient uptake outer membrane protein [Dysgonamonadaceae bacterium]|jgi:hypothetical protein|nr:RagB/SusD family nutrient uptake outer membrane protein [Dysgonamonadaceae bacterium]
MKNILKKQIYFALTALIALFASGCDDFLDREPLSEIPPEKYLWNDAQLSNYVTDNYQILPTHGVGNYDWGTFRADRNTDVMTSYDMDNKYIPGQWKVGSSEGDWSFSRIQQINYFLETVIPRYEAGTLSGSLENCKHYIGEMYFLRAYEYFGKLKALGDFPIITKNYPNEMDVLIEAGKRAPRTEVARFILSDLDKAIEMLQISSPDGQKNRLSRYCAYLLKSRVALYEGTWLKYFKGTAFVPNGTGWPGATKEYNQNYRFQSGSIENEIQFFLGEAMTAAQSVADKIELIPNTWKETDKTYEKNRYFTMFGDLNMSGYSDVLMWRKYDLGLGVANNVNLYEAGNNNQCGITKVMVESFLMQDGLPIYASPEYKGDDDFPAIKYNRDPRLRLFLKAPGQINWIESLTTGPGHSSGCFKEEPWPKIAESGAEKKYNTGYTICKGLNYDFGQTANGGSSNGSIIFRATEAYLNYIEASYEKTGTLDAKADGYWKKIRTNAGMDADYTKTINATDMEKEQNNWGAWSAGQKVNATLYNIRRERSVELMAEGLREQDIKRWRALDQLIDNYYHFEGFKLWGAAIKSHYRANELTYQGVLAKVSNPALGDYLRPYEVVSTSLSYPGAKWCMAHYLNPIASGHFLISAVGSDTSGAPVDYSKSPIYQNPGWGIEADSSPTGY